MDRFVAQANINNFRDRLRNETDAVLRSQLQKSLVDEEDNLAADFGLLADLAREIVKCQQWIERQQLRIEDLERDGHDATAAIALLNRVTETLAIYQNYHRRVEARLERNQ